MIDKLLEHDKLKHFFIGSIFAFALTFIGLNSLIVFALCLSLGITKEIKDHFGNGKVEILDIVYTITTSIILLLL